MMLSLIGLLGSFMLAICGVPQAWKSWRDGHSDGVSSGMLALWGGGTLLMFVYCWQYADMFLLANYAINFSMICVIGWFKARPRIRGYRGEWDA